MLDLEILDQAEKMNRWKSGVERHMCGLYADVNSNEGVGHAYSRLTKGGVWIDSDSFLFGAYVNASFASYRYTLSTNTILAIGEGPLEAQHLVQEQASGIIWQQGGTSYDVQTYNPATHAWTVILALAAEGQFAYNSAGILYFKDSVANYYSCINGAMTVCGAPAGVVFTTTCDAATSFPNKYRYFFASAVGVVAAPRPLVIKNMAAATVKELLLWHNMDLSIGKNDAAFDMILTFGVTTTPYDVSTWAQYHGVNAGSACQIYGDWENMVITRAFPDLNRLGYTMKSCIYNMSTDEYRLLPDYYFPSSLQGNTGFGANGHGVPCVARNYGSHISIWQLGISEMNTTKITNPVYMPLYRFDIPLG